MHYTHTVPCQGVYDRKFVVLYEDRVSGATTAKKLWIDRQLASECGCCSTYLEWKIKHPTQATALQQEADKPSIYCVRAHEKVHVVDGSGEAHEYYGTIRALDGAPNGACTGSASISGPHPFTCANCNALVHGKSSALLHKLNRSTKLKNPHSDEGRALKPGVTHKYISASCLDAALNVRLEQVHDKEKKLQTLQTAYETLQNSWKLSNTTKPFIETLLRLFDEEKLNEFDINFLNTWLLKKDKGMYARADQQVRNLMILLSNKLGEKMYTTLAPVLGLPNSRQARKVRAKETAKHHYLPGINDWAVELAASRELRPIQNSMDGTRVIRVIELYLDQYLVGKEFSPDVRCWPSADNLDVAVDWEQN